MKISFPVMPSFNFLTSTYDLNFLLDLGIEERFWALVVAPRYEMIHWLNKVIECSIHECSLNDKDNDLSYYLIHLGPFCTGQLCMFHLFLDMLLQWKYIED